MAKTTTKTTSDDGKQTIEQLQLRFQNLNKRKIQAETQRENAAERLDELKTEAREKYETDDVEQLRQKLEQMKTENEQKRAKYQTDLDEIEQDLKAVEEKFGDTDPLDKDNEEQS